MSSILKALKKLEEEKSARRAGIDIARGIVKSVPVRRRKRRWLFPVSVSGAAFSAALLTFILMGGPPENKRAADPPDNSRMKADVGERNAEINAGKPGITGGKPLPVGAPSGTGVSMPVSKSKEKESAKKASTTKNSLSRSPEIPLGAKSPAEERRPQKNVQLPSNSASGSVQQPASLPLPVLHVSGIAWDKDGSERFAVVNGASVSEGMTVGGAVVEKIFQDKVRFSFENRTFEVAVGNEMR
jgi:general secretion pathway protein B